MIQLTRINNTSLVLNADLIEQIETTPDTVISLTNGQKYIVRESAAEVMRKSIEYQRQIRQAPETPAVLGRSGPGAADEIVEEVAGTANETQGADTERTLAGPAGEDQG